MALFSRKKSTPEPQLQVPDELATEADRQYGNANFLGALETYGRAIDKIHTMCVVADRSSRIRTPGPDDQEILDGFNNSLGAALATDKQASVSSIVEKATVYLQQIAGEAGRESTRYHTAIESIELTYRLGTS